MTLEVDHGGGHGIPFGRPPTHRCLPHGPLVRQQLRPLGRASVTRWRDSEPANFVDQDEQVALLIRCVSDTDLPADVRAVGVLVLLYGAKITCISTLKPDDVHRTAKGSSTIASAAILGVHIDTAECWTHLAGHNWSAYLEARAQALQCE
ncbi:hypothetical protein [Streptomyces sp. NPDC097610]|uniref:hypothetical protein n=1 Tax=Streptomyces sp. NPDC097610 TaxID=3157227 RepID=UPI003327F490